MTPLRATSAVLGILIAGILLMLVRRDYLHTRYAVWWFFAAGAIVILGVFPGLVDSVGAVLGVRYPPTLLLIVALGMLLIKILTLDLDHSRQQQELRRLTQRLALVESMRCSTEEGDSGATPPIRAGDP